MSEHLADQLMKVSDMLRFFEKYEVSNAIVLLSRIVRVHDLENLDRLRKYVELSETVVQERSR